MSTANNLIQINPLEVRLRLLPVNSFSPVVVALTMFDLRRRNKVNRLGLCGVSGPKFPGDSSPPYSVTFVQEFVNISKLSLETCTVD
jgi:hypothetical protein